MTDIVRSVRVKDVNGYNPIFSCHVACYSTIDDSPTIIGFAGTDYNITDTSHTHRFSLISSFWRKFDVKSAKIPEPRRLFPNSTCYNPISHSIVIIGESLGLSLNESSHRCDLWEYNVGDNSWRELTPFPHNPKHIFTTVYRSLNNSLIMYSGFSGPLESGSPNFEMR